MRGVVISAICHAVLVSLALLGTAKPFDAGTRPIEVDLVRADEIEQRAQEAKPEPEPPQPEQQSAWDVPEKPLIQLPDFSTKAREQTASPSPAPASGQRSAPIPNSQQAALTPAQSRPAPTMQAPAAASPHSVFDPASIPMLMDLPNAAAAAGSQEKGFDFEATVTANLSGEERAAFKAHLRKCWKLPDGLVPAPTTKVVLRVYLRRDGALASEPVLIEASASRDGPAVLQAAKSALHDCQPYAFLPAQKYREWRVLDLSFTPREMAGG